MVTLFEMAFSSFLYSKLTDYENTYLNFRERTGGRPDLARQEHRDYLLEWLNKWGCRFEVEKFPKASEAIGQWYWQHGKRLCSERKNLWKLTGPELDSLGDAYEDLRDRNAFKYRRGGKLVHRHVGATAASKILFSLKPRAAIAWDDLMRKRMRLDQKRLTYRQFLEKAKGDLIDLKMQCDEHGIKLMDLPAELNRECATPAQLMGEYYWVTYTRELSKLDMPDERLLKQWVKWSRA